MLPIFCATLRTARRGWGVETCTWVQQACVLRQAHTRQDADSSMGSQAATPGSDAISGRQEGSETASTAKIGPESSRGSRLVHRQQQRTGRGLQQLPQARGSSSAVAAAAAGPESAASSAALHPPTLADQGPILHKPYSHFVQGYYPLATNYHIKIKGALCTDIELLQFVHGSSPVQVSFVSHPADWDIEGYVQQHPVMQHHQAVQQWVAADSAAGSTQALGPFQGVLNRTRHGRLELTELPYERIKQALAVGGAPHAVVLHERLLSIERPQFVLHTMPVSSDPGKLYKNTLARMISRAGEGPGLQVFPGSVPEVAPAGTIYSNGSGRGGYTIRRELICSQLPADTTYPLKLTLILMDSPGQQGQSSRQLGQWQVKAYKSCRKIYIGGSRILAKFVGYSVAKASLPYDPTQGARLTLTLAATAGQP